MLPGLRRALLHVQGRGAVLRGRACSPGQGEADPAAHQEWRRFDAADVQPGLFWCENLREARASGTIRPRASPGAAVRGLRICCRCLAQFTGPVFFGGPRILPDHTCRYGRVAFLHGFAVLCSRRRLSPVAKASAKELSASYSARGSIPAERS